MHQTHGETELSENGDRGAQLQWANHCNWCILSTPDSHKFKFLENYLASFESQVIVGSKRILCVSWFHNLAETRKLLLTSEGYVVDSVVGTPEALSHCFDSAAELLVMGQSVPCGEKRKIVEAFRRCSQAPDVSLLNANQEKLPEVEYGVDSFSPELLLSTVRSIFSERW